MNNKLKAISTFITVSETGSFSAAARLIGMKQSAVSQQIAALEEELGVVLIRRSTRAMGLTEFGENYLNDMRNVIEAMHEAESRLNAKKDPLHGKIHVQLPSGLGRMLLPNLLIFRKMNPQINMMLSFDDRISDLVTEGVDVALRLSSEPPQTYAFLTLVCIKSALFATRDFEHIQTVSSLLNQPHVRFSGLDIHAPLRLISDNEVIDIKVNTVFRANTTEALLMAIEAGIGIGAMQITLASRAVQAGRLIQLLPTYRLPDRFLYAVYPDARFIPHRTKNLISLIEKELNDIITGDGNVLDQFVT